ncbi:MAG: hypothetical protein KTR15_08045 [Phycisphaeraceae bacterium]|nr:hypothetical protein [Phycisphaeraceae bacterium]
MLAALTLLGSLAVAMVLSRGRLRDQHDLAEKKLEAVQVADALLAQWWAGDPRYVPAGLSGRIEKHPGWVWETQATISRELIPFDAQIIRLRILDESMLGDPIELTSVDVVMPQVVPGTYDSSEGGD